jgi:hypothetical protein
MLKGAQSIGQGNISQGANQIISGASNAMLPVLPFVAAGAPLATARMLATGAAGQKIGGSDVVAKTLNLSPEQQKLAGNLTGIAAGIGGEYGISKIADMPDLVTTALDKATPESIKVPLRNAVQKLTGTTPERVAELAQVENSVADAHSVALQTEASAKTAAKAAFPDIQTPVQLAPKYAEGGWQGEHFVTADELQPQQLPFRAAQEQYSQLALDARAAHVSRMRGQITGFDEAAILKQKSDLGAAMQSAAEADGKLPDYLSAKQGFMQFMNDFHNKGSAIEPLLEMKPDETSKIVGHLLSPDKGARTVETLQKYGADVTPIQDLLSKGSTPLKIDVNEAAKLRKVGEEGYGPLRLQESIDQATYNRLPSGAQARLPAWYQGENQRSLSAGGDFSHHSDAFFNQATIEFKTCGRGRAISTA